MLRVSFGTREVALLGALPRLGRLLFIYVVYFNNKLWLLNDVYIKLYIILWASPPERHVHHLSAGELRSLWLNLGSMEYNEAVSSAVVQRLPKHLEAARGRS